MYAYAYNFNTYNVYNEILHITVEIESKFYIITVEILHHHRAPTPTTESESATRNFSTAIWSTASVFPSTPAPQ